MKHVDFMEIEQMRQRRNAGYSYKQLAAIFNRSKTTIIRALNPSFKEKQKEYARRRYQRLKIISPTKSAGNSEQTE